jgi:hypothetical protein
MRYFDFRLTAQLGLPGLVGADPCVHGLHIHFMEIQVSFWSNWDSRSISFWLAGDEYPYPAAKTVDVTSNMHGSCSSYPSSSPYALIRITNMHP